MTKSTKKKERKNFSLSNLLKNFSFLKKTSKYSTVHISRMLTKNIIQRQLKANKFHGTSKLKPRAPWQLILKSISSMIAQDIRCLLNSPPILNSLWGHLNLKLAKESLNIPSDSFIMILSAQWNSLVLDSGSLCQ